MSPSAAPVRRSKRTGRLVQMYLDPELVEAVQALAARNLRTFKAETILAYQAHLRAAGLQPPSPEDASEGE